jgi:cell fate regulator YaaT (PSP1 superfamily)
MIKIVGVRFKSAGKIYDFEGGAFVLTPGEPVIVETEQGLALGYVAVPPRILEDETSARPLKKIFRLAVEEDFLQEERNRDLEKNAHHFCMDCIEQLELQMNLFSVESTFDASKLTFFFTAEGRVDFRELVKMLVKEFRIRIEMRQVGIRNQAKMCGGIGRCGRMLCCSTFLEKFEPVSIRMAKEQGLSLNPTKISGLCGRLMCCLTYEYDVYMDLKKTFPAIGTVVKTTSRGMGRIVRHNVVCGRVGVVVDDGTEIEITLDEIDNKEN